MAVDGARRRQTWTMVLAALAGLGLGLVFIALDIFADVYVLDDGTLFANLTSPVELWIRASVLVVFVVFALTYARLLITKREVAASEQRYRALAESAHDDIFIVGPERTIDYLNTYAAKEFGAPLEEIVGKHVADVFEPSMRETMGADLRQAFAGEEVYTEHEFVFPARTVWLSTRLVPLRDRDGNVTSVMGVSRDITDGKRRADLTSALNDINALVHSRHSFVEIMDAVIGEAARTINAESGMVLTCDDKRWTVSYAYGFAPGVVGSALTSKDAGAFERIWDTREALCVNDTRANEPQIAERFNIDSMLGVPLVTRRGVIGVIAFGRFKDSSPFSDQDVFFIKRVASTVSLALENARLLEIQRDVAKTLQTAILVMPDELPGIDFGVSYHSASDVAEVGGDFYDLFEVDGGRIGVIIGDVSGKGVDAAALTSLVKNTLKAYAYEEESPAADIAKTNHVVTSLVDEAVFVTVFLGIIDTSTGLLEYCNAGHPAPILRRANGRAQLLASHSPVVGAFEELPYEEGRVELSAEDLLVFYTDGATEARRGTEFFGESRLVRAVEQLGRVPVEEVPQRIYADVLDFTEGRLSDDLALMALALRNGHKPAE